MTRQTKRVLWAAGMAIAAPVVLFAAMVGMAAIMRALGGHAAAVVPLALVSALAAGAAWTWPGWKQ